MKKVYESLIDLTDGPDPSDFALADSIVVVEEVASIEEIAADTPLTDAELRKVLSRPKNELTETDALRVNDAMKLKLAQIRELKGRLSKLKTSILEEISGTEDSSTRLKSVTVDDRIVKKAIKRSFGKKTSTITFEMYQEALDVLETLESEDSAEYVRGDWVE